MITFSRDQRNKLLTTGFVALAALLVLYFGLIRMQLRARESRRARISEAQSKMQEANRLIQMTAKYQQDLDEKKTQLAAIEAGMASDGDLNLWMIRTMSNFRIPYLVDIPNYSTVRVGEVGLLPNFPYPAAFYTVNGTAYYHDLGKFIADFENRFPYMCIQNLDLKPTSGVINPEDQEKLAFQMEMVALVAKPVATH